jgi:hypothetical protein
MTDYGHELRFGVFITPAADQAAHVVELAKLVDLVALDLVTLQDHPYQPRFLDTWTLLSVLAAQTTSVRVAPNVANLPLRPPVLTGPRRRHAGHPQRRPRGARPWSGRLLGRNRRRRRPAAHGGAGR